MLTEGCAAELWHMCCTVGISNWAAGFQAPGDITLIRSAVVVWRKTFCFKSGKGCVQLMQSCAAQTCICKMQNDAAAEGGMLLLYFTKHCCRRCQHVGSDA
jgi:hypothetical protein